MSDYPTNPERTVVVTASDRIHWGTIVAAMFVTLSVFVVSMVLAFAVGLGPTYGENLRANYATSAIIWGGATAFIAFGLGGYLAAFWTKAAGNNRAALHGMLVWAVTVPVLVYVIGAGVGPMLSAYGNPSQSVMQAMQTPGVNATGANVDARDVSSAAWWMLIVLGAGLIGAIALGYAGAGSRRDHRTSTIHRT